MYQLFQTILTKKPFTAIAISWLFSSSAMAAGQHEILPSKSNILVQSPSLERAASELQVRSLKRLFKNEELTVDQYMDSLTEVGEVKAQRSGTAMD